MFRFVVFTTLVATALAYGNGGGYSSGGYGGGSATGGLSGLGGLGLAKAGGLTGGLRTQGASLAQGGLVTAAVQSRRLVQYVDVPSQYEAPIPLAVEVPANQQPIQFLFRSASSPLDLQTAHEGSKGSYDETSSQDEPHVRSHTVTRPVVQNIQEIIAPFRKIQQQVQPVQEEVLSLVSRGQLQQALAQPSYGTTAQRTSGSYAKPTGSFSSFTMGAPKAAAGGY